MKASFIIVFHNGARYASPCIDSILGQSSPELKIEIIAVDNASSDGTAALISEKYPSVDLVPLRENVGFSQGNDLAYARSRGEFICCVNQDVILSRGWLWAGIRALQKDDNAVACASNMIMPWIMSLEEFKRKEVRNCPVFAYRLTSFGFASYVAFHSKQAVPTNFVSGGAFLIRRGFIEQEPYFFDAKVFMYAEDIDLSLRILAKGKKILLEPSCVVYHDQAPISGPVALQMRKLFMVTWNRFGVLSKHFAPLEFIIRLPLFLMGIPLKNWFLNVPIWKRIIASRCGRLSDDRSDPDSSLLDSSDNAFGNLQIMRILKSLARRRVFLRHALSLVVLGAVIAFYAKKIDYGKVLDLLPNSDWMVLFAGYFLTGMVFAVRSLRWARLLARFSISLSYLDAFLMNLVEIFFSNFVSALSPYVRALYLGDRVCGTSERLRFLFLDKMFDWFIPLSIALIALPYFVFNWNLRFRWAVLIVVLLILPFVVQVGLYVLRKLMSCSWPSWIERGRMWVISRFSLRFAQVNWQAFMTWYGLSVLGFALYYASIFLIARSFLLRIDFIDLVFIDAVATLSVFVPLNFAGISTRDVALAGLLVLNGSPEESVSLFALAIIVLRFFLSGSGWISMNILRLRGHHLLVLKGDTGEEKNANPL